MGCGHSSLKQNEEKFHPIIFCLLSVVTRTTAVQQLYKCYLSGRDSEPNM